MGHWAVPVCRPGGKHKMCIFELLPQGLAADVFLFVVLPCGGKNRYPSAGMQPAHQVPIYMPGLAEVVKQCRGKNLFFSTSVQAAIKDAGFILLRGTRPRRSRNTPIARQGREAVPQQNLFPSTDVQAAIKEAGSSCFGGKVR